MKVLRKLLILSLFCLCVLVNKALSQSYQAIALKGMEEFDIVMDLNTDSPCGISKDDINTRVRYVVGQSTIRLVTFSPHSIYVNVNALSTCSAAEVSVFVISPVTINGTGVVLKEAFIWNKSALLSGSNLRTRVLQELEDDCKALVVDWNSVNKP